MPRNLLTSLRMIKLEIIRLNLKLVVMVLNAPAKPRLVLKVLSIRAVAGYRKEIDQHK